MQRLLVLFVGLVGVVAHSLPVPVAELTGGAAEKAPSTTPQAVQPPLQQYPWPYPPSFERFLPLEAKQQLFSIYLDTTLSPADRSQKVNAVFDSLPLEVVQRLPLPNGYERLPADVFSRVWYVKTAPSFSWEERQTLTRAIIESLPEQERALINSPRLAGPPPGFESVLSPSVYKQLLKIHYNPFVSKVQKAELITRVMRQVPASEIEKLPLPLEFRELPEELQRRVRTLVFDYSVEQKTRAERVRQFVASLPEELRPVLR
jgi:hypothetical protein